MQSLHASAKPHNPTECYATSNFTEIKQNVINDNTNQHVGFFLFKSIFKLLIYFPGIIFFLPLSHIIPQIMFKKLTEINQITHIIINDYTYQCTGIFFYFKLFFILLKYFTDNAHTATKPHCPPSVILLPNFTEIKQIAHIMINDILINVWDFYSI